MAPPKALDAIAIHAGALIVWTRVHAITIGSQLDAIAIHAVTAIEGSPVDTWMQWERPIFIGQANQNDRLDRDGGPIPTQSWPDCRAIMV